MKIMLLYLVTDMLCCFLNLKKHTLTLTLLLIHNDDIQNEPGMQKQENNSRERVKFGNTIAK